MPFNSPLSQDAAIPQGEYQEHWESTRYRQDQPQQQQQFNQDHVQSYHHDVNVRNQDQNPISDVGENPHYNLEPAQRAPAWMSTALSRQPNPGDGDHNPTAMHAGGASSSAFLDQSGYSHWLGAGHRSQFEQNAGEDSDLQYQQQATRMATELNLSAAHGRENAPQAVLVNGVPSYPGEFMTAEDHDWAELRQRCLIVTHPGYPEMLQRHVECLRVSTPVDQLPFIEEQLADAPTVTEKYRVLRDEIGEISPEEQAELDYFMSEYTPMLAGFRDTLQAHVFHEVTDAMMGCWEVEKALVALMGAGVILGAGWGPTMSDDEEEDYDSDYGSYDQSLDYNDSGGYGPLVPTETERTLMERVRQELKHELKQGYKSKIEDVREEILRKRRAGKLPEGTTTVLKAWWQAHSKWPYPTEDEKEILIQETGLELKQVNNWFINQRKRNWHSNPLASASTSDSGKNKQRKSW